MTPLGLEGVATREMGDHWPHPGLGWESVLPRGAPAGPVVPHTPGHSLPLQEVPAGHWPHSQEALTCHLTGSQLRPGPFCSDSDQSLCLLEAQFLSGVTFLSVSLPFLGFGGWAGGQRWRCALLRNRLACTSSKHRVPFAEEVRGVGLGHAEHSWAASE